MEMCILFFFQAEDGIRDSSVTGVQTCALPISVDQVSDGVRFGPSKTNVRNTGAVLAASVSLGGSITGTDVAPVCPCIGLPGAGLPSKVSRRILQIGRASCRERV